MFLSKMLPWWAWLLIALAAIILIAVVIYFIIKMTRKSKVEYQPIPSEEWPSMTGLTPEQRLQVLENVNQQQKPSRPPQTTEQREAVRNKIAEVMGFTRQ